MQRGLIALALVVFCFAFQGSRGLFETDEGRYTAVANEMLRLDDWIHPRLHRDQPHWTKPPLTYWSMASGIKVFGHTEFAVRLTGALSFFLTVLLVYRIAMVLRISSAWAPPLIYASSFGPAVASNIVSTDNLLTLMETAAVYAYVQHIWGHRSWRSIPWVALMWGFFGLAFMVKGPPGLLPLAAIGVNQLLMRRHPQRRSLGLASGLVIFTLIAAPWPAYVIWEDPSLLDYFVNEEIVGRMAGQHHRNPQWYGPIVAYGPVIIGGTLPWTGAMLARAYKGVAGVFKRKDRPRAAMPDTTRFLLLWIFVPFLVFVSARSRLPLYLLPSFAPLALVLGRGQGPGFGSWKTSRRVLLIVWLVLLLGMREGAAHLPHKHDSRATAHAFDHLPSDSYDEVVFYGRQPLFGLSFYLGKEVGRVWAENIEAEVRRPGRRLWIVETYLRKDLERRFKKAGGYTLAEVGFLDLHDCLIFREVAP